MVIRFKATLLRYDYNVIVHYHEIKCIKKQLSKLSIYFSSFIKQNLTLHLGECELNSWKISIITGRLCEFCASGRGRAKKRC